MRLRLFLLLWLFPVLAPAQFTTVTATVTSLQNATYTFDFVNQASGGPPLLGGISVFPTTVTGAFDASGHLSVSLADNNQVIPIPSQWRLSVTLCKGSASGPIGFNIQQTITGTAVDLSSALTAALPSIPTGCNGGGGGSGSVQPAPQFRLFIQPNLGTQAVAGPASTIQNAVTPLLQGIGNTDLYANGAGNNGIANFFAANPTGTAIVPPTSTDTESSLNFSLPSLGRLDDYRQGIHINLSHNSTLTPQFLNCGNNAPADGLSICNVHTYDLNYQNALDKVDEFLVAGHGYNLGNPIGINASGWSHFAAHSFSYDELTRGIKQGWTGYFNCHAVGDCGFEYPYITSDGGAVEASGEGTVGLSLHVSENTSFYIGNCSTGCTTGSNLITMTHVSGQSNFTDGSYVIDVSKPGATVTVGSLGTTMGVTVENLTSGTVTQSTAWGTLATATTSAANGQFQVPVSQTINVTLGTSPASPGNFTVGNACIVGAFAEQAQVTAVGTPSGGVQSVTFLTRYAYAAGTVIMQGGDCGKSLTITGSAWPSLLFVSGAFSTTQIAAEGCQGGQCTNSNVPAAILGALPQSVTLYPSAEIIGTNKNQANTVELAYNTVPFAVNDDINDPHPSSPFFTGESIFVSQKTAVNAGDGVSGLLIDYTGPASASTNNSADINLTNDAFISTLLNLGINSKATYGAAIEVWGNGANPNVIQVETTGDEHLFYQDGAPFNTLDMLAAGGLRSGSSGALMPMYAINVPPIPTAQGQIPIATSILPFPQATSDYTPTAISGDATLASSGALTVMKSNGNPICTSTGGPCSTGIANVQVVLPTAALAANTCSAVITTTMTGVVTTSTFTSAFATDASAVTGYGSSGGLSIVMWPTANTNNLKVCNPTASSITPGAMTINVGAR